MLRQVLEVLSSAVMCGAAEVLASRREGRLGITYKEPGELVTLADTRSDAVIRAMFEAQLPALVPGITFQLEESGGPDTLSSRRAGADPLDGTDHFAAGGNCYCIQAHYVEDGIPQIGVILQPEVFLPLAESAECIGRLVYATKGEGAFYRRTTFKTGAFLLGDELPVHALPVSGTRSFAAAVPVSVKMSPEDLDRAIRVYRSGLMSASTGLGSAGANVMMVVFGGHQVYANLGSGNDLDLIPPQVIAEEAGLTVWGSDRRSPIWHVRKQPVVVAPSGWIAECFLCAAGI